MEKKISGKHGNRVAVMKERMAAVVLASALLLGGGLTAKAQNTAVTTCSQSAATAIQQNPNWKANATEWQKLKGEITLYMTNDMGRNGYYDQKPIAELMGEMADVVGPECVIAAGDIHHFNGVASTQDPLWLTNYEWVYSHPELMLDWFAVCGTRDVTSGEHTGEDRSQNTAHAVYSEEGERASRHAEPPVARTP